VAVFRHSSVEKLDEFTAHDGFTVMTAPVVSDEATLTQALAGCDAVVAVLIAVRRLKASELVKSLAKATAANGVKRVVFTAGEITAVREEGEAYNLDDQILRASRPRTGERLTDGWDAMKARRVVLVAVEGVE
jgi:methylmalonyl-CoA mutase cobalamin-binding subunit